MAPNICIVRTSFRSIDRVQLTLHYANEKCKGGATFIKLLKEKFNLLAWVPDVSLLS